MKKFIKIAAIIIALVSNSAAQNLKVFAASSTKFAMQEIVEEFKLQHPKDSIEVTYSATGKAYAQLLNGLGYDIFMAADSLYPKKIAEDGNALGEAKVYALGRLALFAHDPNLLKEGLESLKNKSVKHISIANPKVAPYGAAAMDILKNYNLLDDIKSKLVLGDNMAQSVQFVESGAAEVGIVAFSLIKNKEKSHYLPIDPTKYKPLEHSFVLTKYAKEKPLAQEFADFILSQKSQEIFKKYGF